MKLESSVFEKEVSRAKQLKMFCSVERRIDQTCLVLIYQPNVTTTSRLKSLKNKRSP